MGNKQPKIILEQQFGEDTKFKHIEIKDYEFDQIPLMVKMLPK